MNDENKAIIRNSLIRYIQREIGDDLDDHSRILEYEDIEANEMRYIHFGIRVGKDFGNHNGLYLIFPDYAVTNTPTYVFNEGTTYLGTVDLTQICAGDGTHEEYTEFQSKIEAFLDSILKD